MQPRQSANTPARPHTSSRAKKTNDLQNALNLLDTSLDASEEKTFPLQVTSVEIIWTKTQRKMTKREKDNGKEY